MIAVVDPAGQMGYAELDARSGGVARFLVAQGVRVGEPVVLHVPLSRWAVVGMLGVLRAGAQYVPIDAAFPAGRRAQMELHSGARIALTEPLLRTIAPDPGFDWIPGPHAYTMFTSGSTGTPKPVTVTRDALAYSTQARLSYYDGAPEAFLLCSSISFDSSVAGIYWTLCTGGRLIIPGERPADVPALVKFARAHRPTHTLLVPSLYRLLLRAPHESLSSLTTVIVAGETCPPDLVDRHYALLPQAVLYNEYGPTECTVWSTVHRCRPGEDPVPIGAPIPGTTVSIVDGQLCIESPGVVCGGPVYHTGDLASRGGDGLLRFHGRADGQLKAGGMRIEPAEIEHALCAYPGVHAAAVGPDLVAHVVCDGPLDEPALRTHLLARLPAVAVPRSYRLVAALPTLPNGKLDRRALAG